MRDFLVNRIGLGLSSLVLAFSASGAHAIPAQGLNGAFFLGNSGGNTINAGQSIDNSVFFLYTAADGSLATTGATCRLKMQEDGNLVLSKTVDNSVIWESGTRGNPGAYAAIQGNFLTITGAFGQQLWSSPKFESADTDFLGINEACALRVYDAAHVIALDFHTSIAPEATLWAGSTLNPGQYLEDPTHQYKLQMQDNGNLVLLRASDNVVMAQSGTTGNPGAYAAMQSDGNFVIFSKDGKQLVSSGSGGHPRGYFFLELGPTSPYLTIYTSVGFSMKALWWQLPPVLLNH